MANENVISQNEKVFQKTWTKGEESRVKHIVIPDDITSIPDNTFMGLMNTVVTVPETVWFRILSTDYAEQSFFYNIGDAEDSESSVVFKVVKSNGEYFYTYAYQEEFFDKCIYYFMFWGPDEDMGAQDDDIDEAFLDEVGGFRLPLNSKIIARMCRLASPIGLSNENKTKFISYIKRNIDQTVEAVAALDCPDMLKCLFTYNLIKPELKKQIPDILAKAFATECIDAYDEVSNVEVEVLPKTATKKASQKVDVTAVNFDIEQCRFEKFGFRDCDNKPGVQLYAGKKGFPVEITLANGKKYKYLNKGGELYSRDCVIIGSGFVSKDNTYSAKSKTTGSCGFVSDYRPSSGPKKAFAVEIAFAFTTYTCHLDLSECAKRLLKPSSAELKDYFVIPTHVYPISYMVKRMLAALTLLDYANKAPDCVEAAKEYLNRKQVLSRIYPVGSKVCISDMNSTVVNGYAKKALGEKAFIEDGFISVSSEEVQKYLASSEFAEFFDGYVALGTAEVLIRCGIDTLLKVYLENSKVLPIYKELLIAIAEEYQSTNCLNLLRTV